MLVCQILRMAWEICCAVQKTDWSSILSPGKNLLRKHLTFFLFLFFFWRLVTSLPPFPLSHPSSSLISLSFSVAVPHCQPIPAYLQPKSGCAWLIPLIKDWMPAVHKGGGGGEGMRERELGRNWERIRIIISILVLFAKIRLGQCFET